MPNRMAKTFGACEVGDGILYQYLVLDETCGVSDFRRNHPFLEALHALIIVH